MSDATDIAAELMEAYQDFSESTPTLTHGSEEVDIMPNIVGNDPVFVPGGSADSEQFEVATLASDWDSPPLGDLEVVTLANHATAPDGTYQVFSRRLNEAWLVFTLGNSDAQ